MEKYADQFYQMINAYTTVSSTSFDKLWQITKIREVQKDELILRYGQVAKNILFVCQGILTSQYYTKDGTIHIKNFFVEGKMAGSTASLLTKAPSEFAIQAVTDSVLLSINYAKYRTLIFENDDLKSFYIAYLEQHWIIVNEKRQISFATQTASERYQTFLQEYPDLEDKVPQKLIASYLGVTPTQLSRIRNP
ncbi:MAG: Crp/Fnr family transcriptional regulator [Bacteroidota bacterium]